MTTVLISGALANRYLNGGAAWTRLNWILGLRQLGFKVCFVEQIRRESCVDSRGAGAAAPTEKAMLAVSRRRKGRTL